MKKLFKILTYLISSILTIVLVLLVYLWIISPGTAEPVTDQNGKIIPGSISSIEKVKLGGIDQYLIIRGQDSTKPVMLYLHGGPGSPEMVFMKDANRAIEKDFVMVYWEERGAGKTYSSDMQEEKLTLEQMIEDTRELSISLAKRFQKDKIYLMGHSWGSFMGILTANKYPELYHAYFGIGQVCDQYRAEQISFDWVQKQARISGDKHISKKLTSLKFPDKEADMDVWMDFMMTERNYVGKYGGGVTHQMTSMWPVIKMVLGAQEYTFSEKINYSIGNYKSLKKLWPEVLSKNLSLEIDSMRLPVYIFQGKYDYQTSYDVAKEFFEQLKASEKEFFTFENSAHSPLMEEVEKFNGIVRGKVEAKAEVEI